MGTTISGQTHGTSPTPRTARIPASGTRTFLAPEIAATWSPVVVPISSLSNGSGGTIVSDATTGLAFGANVSSLTGPGQEAAINAGMAAVLAASTSGATFIWDVAVALGGPVYGPGSNIAIIAPNYGCGAILRLTANCPLFRSFGTNANMTIAANTQNTFGKFDPAAPGGSQNYRVFDPAFVASKNLMIEGGTWNSAPPYQSQLSNTAYGIISAFQLWGVDGLQVFNVHMIQALQYHIHVLNFRNFEYGGIEIDGALVQGSDGLHINGPGYGIEGGHIKACTGDDPLAISADDGPNQAPWVAGINIQCGGDLLGRIDVQGVELWGGTNNVVPFGSLRLLSNYHRIEDVIVHHTQGNSGQHATLQCQPLGAGGSGALCPGNGNYGSIVIDGFYTDTDPVINFVMTFGGFIDRLVIKNRYRYNSTPNTDIGIVGTIAIMELDWTGYQPAGAANNTQAALAVFGSIGHLRMRATSRADSSIGTRAAPFIITNASCNITLAELDLNGDKITNLINHSAGRIDALILSGCHSNAGGGSPLNTNSPVPVTNYCYSAAGGNLAYVIANGAKSGTGTVTSTNVYSGP